MSHTDAINAYRLFLGRNPESERVVQEKADIPVAKLAAGFLGAREFSERILPPLTTGYPMPHFRVGATPDAEILAWAAQSLPISEPTRAALADAKTWRQLLRGILADQMFRQASPPGLSKVYAELDGAVNGRPFVVERELVGGIEHLSGFEIRGWAADLFSPDEPLTLEVFLDNAFAGTVT